MAPFIKKYKDKVGLPPGTLIHVGRESSEQSKITIFNYDEKQFEEQTVNTVEDCLPYIDKPGKTWINIAGVHQTEIIESVGNHFSIHPLVLADIVNTRQRPKIEDFENYLFVVLKMIYSGENGHNIKSEQVSLIIGSNYVISFQEQEGDVFNPIRNRVRGGGVRWRKMGTDYLAYALIDAIVDNYFVVIESIGEKVEEIEEKLLSNPNEETMQAIHSLKRNLILLRKSVWPLREVTSVLERAESKLIHKSTRIYLRDVYDHIIQVIDSIETSRDILSGMLDVYLSSVSNRMNIVMKVLTIIATIFIPLTFIAGIYGMNFENMPELGWRFGYPAVLLLMTVIAAVMLLFFRRKRWL